MWELTNQEISEGILNEGSHHDNIIVKGQEEQMQKHYLSNLIVIESVNNTQN